jgi:hypothetical protein
LVFEDAEQITGALTVTDDVNMVLDNPGDVEKVLLVERVTNDSRHDYFFPSSKQGVVEASMQAYFGCVDPDMVKYCGQQFANTDVKMGLSYSTTQTLVCEVCGCANVKAASVRIENVPIRNICTWYNIGFGRVTGDGSCRCGVPWQGKKVPKTLFGRIVYSCVCGKRRCPSGSRECHFCSRQMKSVLAECSGCDLCKVSLSAMTSARRKFKEYRESQVDVGYMTTPFFVGVYKY